jgi:thioredoxin reductase
MHAVSSIAFELDMKRNDPNTCDVLIVGGGPAGLSAALMLGRSNRKVVLVDAGQPRNAAAREFHGYLGRDCTSIHKLLRDARQEVAKYGIQIFDDVVVAADVLPLASQRQAGSAFYIRTQNGLYFVGRKLLFATGTRDELPEFPGIRECYGLSVHHCPYCDGWEHRDKRLVAFGKEANDAVGLGLSLQTWSTTVTVLTNGKPISICDKKDLELNRIAYCEDRILEVIHNNGLLQGVRLENQGVLAADALFFNTNQKPACSLPQFLGCDTNDEAIAQTRKRQKTNVPGLFLAGDADGDVQFVIVAAAEGATAAVAINCELQIEDRQQHLLSQTAVDISAYSDRSSDVLTQL